MKEKNALLYTAGVLIATFVFIFVLSFLLNMIFPDGRMLGRSFEFREFMEDFLMVKTFISVVNAVLLIYLIYSYVSFYNEIKSQFSLGLIVMALALFAYTISDNPLFQMFFGLRGAGLGPFNIIPSMFTLIAVLVLIYLSRK